GFGLRLVGSASGGDLLLVLPVSVAWAVDDDDVAVVDHAIDEGGGAEVIAEVITPALPRDVAGDHRRALVVVPGEQDLLHQSRAPGLVALDLLEPDLVDDEQLGADVRLERAGERVVGEA